MTITVTEGGSVGTEPNTINESDWIVEPGKRYCLPVALGPKEEDGWPVYCLLLPGVATFGLTKEEALEQAKEALLGVIEEYRASGQEIPWQPSKTPDAESEIRWVWLDVE